MNMFRRKGIEVLVVVRNKINIRSCGNSRKMRLVIHKTVVMIIEIIIHQDRPLILLLPDFTRVFKFAQLICSKRETKENYF